MSEKPTDLLNRENILRLSGLFAVVCLTAGCDIPRESGLQCDLKTVNGVTRVCSKDHGARVSDEGETPFVDPIKEDRKQHQKKIQQQGYQAPTGEPSSSQNIPVPKSTTIDLSKCTLEVSPNGNQVYHCP